MEGFKKYVQGTLGNWMLNPENLYVGREFEIPSMKGRRGGTVRIVAMDKTHVWILQPSQNAEFNDPKYATKIPISSLYGFIDDLSGQLTLKPKSGNEYIDAILDNKAEYLDKGEDGVTYRVNDKAVKVGTTVPYHPVHYNRPHRTPEEAIQNLRNEYNTSQDLIKKGVPGILPGQFIVYDGRGFYIRPFIDVFTRESKLSLPQLLELKESVEKIHEAGYAIRDEIQIGSYNGHVYHYDLGAAQANTDKWTKDGDIQNVASWFARSDFDLFNPPTYKELSFEEKTAKFKLKKKKS